MTAWLKMLVLAAASAALLQGCADAPVAGGGSGIEPMSDAGTIVGDVSDPRNRARVHTELAGLYYGRGNLPVALEELRIATASDPSYATAYSMLGLVYSELRERQLAQVNFERAIRLAPNDHDINHNYGAFLCQNGREEESIKYFLQAVRNPLYPTPWRSYSAAGACSMRLNNVKQADEFYQRALKLEPDDPASLLPLGQIRYQQGSLEEARKLVARYNKLVSPTAESLWLALRIERRAGARTAEQAFATQLRRRFPGSPEYQALQRRQFD